MSTFRNLRGHSRIICGVLRHLLYRWRRTTANDPRLNYCASECWLIGAGFETAQILVQLLRSLAARVSASIRDVADCVAV